MTLRDFLYSFRPETGTVPWAERARDALAAALAVAVTVGLSAWLLATPPVVVAAIGASSVLTFALPASPLAQPWSVLGSYLLSAIVGVLAARFVPWLPLAAGLAVGGAILAMLSLRCLHPPAGAVALFAVMGGAPVHELGFQYVLTPVAVNALLLLALALVINNLLPGRRYPRPHPELAPPALIESHPLAQGVSHADLKAALEEYGRPLYIAGEELDEILHLAEQIRLRRLKRPGR
jgi:CBS domain-containing membrane protein